LRFACVWVEGFAAAAAERCEPALRERPLAVVSGTPPATRVVDANAPARERGVRPGLPDADAGARCPGLQRRPFCADAVASARHALLEACLAVSPRIADAEAGLVFVDVGGLDRLVGPEPAIALRLARQARAVGLPARVGIAATRATARVAARVGAAVNVLAPGEEAAALAPVALTELPLAPAVVATLARWGVETVGALAALPREGLGTRLGPAGLAAHDLACGRDTAPFRAYTPPPFWEEAQGVEWEIADLIALAALLGRVLERLCARLASAHLCADAIDVSLRLADGGHDTRTVSLACPMDEPPPILALLTLDLERRPPGAPVIAAAVSAHVLARRVAPGGLWQPAAPAARDLATVLARLGALVGRENVGAAVVTDSHRPDAFTLAPFVVAPLDEAVAESGEEAALALRRLRPPRRIEVELQGDRPALVRGALSAEARVTACAGPWRVSGEWWDAAGWARDEWDAALTDGTVCRLAYEPLRRQWFLDGVYD
jgi:protein ImuB